VQKILAVIIKKSRKKTMIYNKIHYKKYETRMTINTNIQILELKEEGKNPDCIFFFTFNTNKINYILGKLEPVITSFIRHGTTSTRTLLS
jgi:hypothetical protein